LGHEWDTLNGPAERDFRNSSSDGENFQRRGGTIAPRGGARIGTPGGTLADGSGSRTRGSRAMPLLATADGDPNRLRHRWPARLEAIHEGETVCAVQGDFRTDLGARRRRFGANRKQKRG